jgi:hypothetical protein
MWDISVRSETSIFWSLDKNISKIRNIMFMIASATLTPYPEYRTSQRGKKKNRKRRKRTTPGQPANRDPS